MPKYFKLEIERRWAVDIETAMALAEGEPRIIEDLYITHSRMRLRKVTAKGAEPVFKLCKKYGTLLVSDEVQTGMFRTGTFLAGQQHELRPDMIVLAKALSGGLIPVGAVLMPDAIYNSVYTSLKRSIVHTSTFSENSLAMRVGLATLDVLEQDQLGPRATESGTD